LISRLDSRDFFVSQQREFILSRSPRELAAILVNEPEEKIDRME